MSNCCLNAVLQGFGQFRQFGFLPLYVGKLSGVKLMVKLLKGVFAANPKHVQSQPLRKSCFKIDCGSKRQGVRWDGDAGLATFYVVNVWRTEELIKWPGFRGLETFSSLFPRFVVCSPYAGWCIVSKAILTGWAALPG